MAKKQQVAFDATKGTVTVTYPTIGKSVAVDLNKLSEEVKWQGLGHGIKQRLGDAASGGTAKEKFEMASRIVEAMLGGTWDIGDRMVDNESIVIEAVARLKDRDAEDVEAALPDDEDKRAAIVKDWRSNAKVKAEIAKIRAERAEADAAGADELEIDGLDD